MALFYTSIKRDLVSLLKFAFFSHVLVFLWEISLEISIQLFFALLLFPCHGCSVHLYVLNAVSYRWKIVFLCFFNVVIGSLYWCIHVIFNASESSSSIFFFFLDTIVCHHSDVRPRASLSTFLSSFFFSVHFRNNPEYYYHYYYYCELFLQF